MKRIVWLASYPRSGNTWLRVLLENLRAGGTQPVSINALSTAYASDRALFETCTGLEAADLSPAEIARLRPAAYRELARRAEADVLLKVHDAYRPGDDAPPLFPQEATRAVVYVIRNPLDVCLSWAAHQGQDVETAIAQLNDPSYALHRHRHRPGLHLDTVLRTWRAHVQSWMDAPLPLHVVRYEDLLAHTADTFEAVVRFLGWTDDRGRIEQAVRFSRFERLQAQERAASFREKPARPAPFFRRGQSGGWRTDLTARQVEQVVAAQHDVMARFGYLHDGAARR